MRAFAAMGVDERWVHRSAQVMFETFHWFRGEGFGLIIEDLLDLPEHPPVVVEGFRLLPRLVQPLLTDPRRAVWLLPTPETRRTAFERRRPTGAPWTFIDHCADPDRALRNLLERDRLFTAALARDATTLGLHTIAVDLMAGDDDVTMTQVVDWFGL